MKEETVETVEDACRKADLFSMAILPLLLIAAAVAFVTSLLHYAMGIQSVGGCAFVATAIILAIVWRLRKAIVT